MLSSPLWPAQCKKVDKKINRSKEMPSSFQVPCGLETVINSWSKKKCFITILLLTCNQLPCQPPFLGPWRESVSSSLSDANSAFGLILGFFSYHGWNIYLLPAGCFKQAAICWDIQRACGEQAWQKLFRHFLLPLLWKCCCLLSVCMHVCTSIFTSTVVEKEI